MMSMSPTPNEDRASIRSLSVGPAAELAELSGRLRRALRAGVRRDWPYDQLSTAQLDLLRLLADHGARVGLSVTGAAEHLGVAPNTVSGLVRQMTDEGLIVRRPDPGDRRVGRLHASALALRRLRRWRGFRDALLADALGQLDAVDQAALTAAVGPLRRLVAALEQPREA
jgi:DNA-binding MarR family transcriptional regulator